MILKSDLSFRFVISQVNEPHYITREVLQRIIYKVLSENPELKGLILIIWIHFMRPLHKDQI